MANDKAAKRTGQKAENGIRNRIPLRAKLANGVANGPNLFVRIYRWWHADKGPVFYIRVISGLGLVLLSLSADITALSDVTVVSPPVSLPVATAVLTCTPTVVSKKSPILVPTPTTFPTPTNTPVPPLHSHEVQEGENLSCIAAKYYGDAKHAFTICAYNYELGRIGPNCDKLQVGEILIIPTHNQSNRLPLLVLTPGVRGLDYFCENSDAALVKPVSPLEAVTFP